MLEKTKQVAKKVQEMLGDDYKVTPYYEKRGAAVTYRIVIHHDGDKLMPHKVDPAIRIDHILPNEDWSVDAIAKLVLDLYRSVDETPDELAVFRDLSIYEKMRSYLTLRLVNRKINREWLEDKPYTPFLEDLAAVVVLRNGDFSLNVSDRLLEEWKISFEQAYKDASENFYKTRVKIWNMEELVPAEDEEAKGMYGFLYVVSNLDMKYGAACMMNTMAMSTIAHEMGCDLFVLPSSENEIMVIPLLYDLDLTDLFETWSANITEINHGGMLCPDEILSDHPYIFRRVGGWERVNEYGKRDEKIT